CARRNITVVDFDYW
nr:immunoglobulin heavy chain junction region [Mus musculus]